MRKNCSSDQEKRLKFKAEGREFAKILRSLEQFIQTVEGQKNFREQNVFLTCSWRFLISNNLNSNWKKLLGFRNMQEKLDIFVFLLLCSCCFWYFSGGFQLKGVYNKSDGYQIMSYSQYRRLLIIVVLSGIRTFFGGSFCPP